MYFFLRFLSQKQYNNILISQDYLLRRRDGLGGLFRDCGAGGFSSFFDLVDLFFFFVTFALLTFQ